MAKVVGLLRPDDFYREAHRKIFRAASSLFEEGVTVDFIMLVNKMRDLQELEEVGGIQALTGCMESGALVFDIESYANLVRSKASTRELIRLGAEIVSDCYEGEQPVAEIVNRVEDSLISIAEREIRTRGQRLGDVITQAFTQLEDNISGSAAGVTTGYPELDQMIIALQPGDLTILAGRPSHGKTAFALNLIRNACVERSMRALMFSLEMSMVQLALRLLAMEARVNANRLRSGNLTAGDWSRLTTAAGTMAEARVVIDDTAALKLIELRARAKRMQAEMGLDLVIVDYLQLVTGTGENRQQEVAAISRGLKVMAKELNLPVVALSQLSRAADRRGQEKEGGRPRLSDLRDSGSLEQDADTVMFVHRPDLFSGQYQGGPSVAEVIVGKQRNGPIGTVNLIFLPEFGSFEPVSRPTP
jgi:replicative DNA helicase